MWGIPSLSGRAVSRNKGKPAIDCTVRLPPLGNSVSLWTPSAATSAERNGVDRVRRNNDVINTVFQCMLLCSVDNSIKSREVSVDEEFIM